MPELTLPELLHRAANEYPHLGISYVQDNGTLVNQSYPELLKESAAMARGLFSLGLQPGDKAIIATSQNRQTITLLWACLLGGIVPTILQPPVTFNEYNPAASKLLNVFRQMGKPWVLTSGITQDSYPEMDGNIIHFADIPHEDGAIDIHPSLDTLAFIQYSSGSTGEPKGIMLSHRNIALNLQAITIGLDLHPNDHVGNWMPLYHDMGLIGYHLTLVSVPAHQFHIDTVDFIKNPGLWLDMMTRYQISVTGCPNFGQALVLRYMKRKPDGQNWNFSSMKALLNGAEPISVRIMEEFNRSMMKYGFAEEAMMPVYGMAEATLAISFSPLMEPSVITGFDAEMLDRQGIAVKTSSSARSRQVRNIVSVGKPLNFVDIRIVDEHDKPVPESHIGHIQVKGGSITGGYFEQPEATSKVFTDGWLRTGDLGFLFEGNLYITGRFKDIIFVNGRNFFSHDLENMACSLEGFTYGKIVFGGITDTKTGKEKVLAFVAGVPSESAGEMLHRLRTLLRKNLGIHLDELILVRSNEIPKTSSGKIQRYRLIQQYLLGSFKDNRIR